LLPLFYLLSTFYLFLCIWFYFLLEHKNFWVIISRVITHHLCFLSTVNIFFSLKLLRANFTEGLYCPWWTSLHGCDIHYWWRIGYYDWLVWITYITAC
jgi:hypothetical protein